MGATGTATAYDPLERRSTLVTAASLQALTPEVAKDFLRVDSDDEDVLVESLIAEAIDAIERATGRALITQTWDVKYPRFPDSGVPIELPRAPLQGVTSVTYVDADGASQTWASSNYSVDAPAGPFAIRGRLIPGYEVTYPTTRLQPDAVTIRYTAGYGDAPEDVPGGLSLALLRLVADGYAFRETAIAGAVLSENRALRGLVRRYRLDRVVAL